MLPRGLFLHLPGRVAALDDLSSSRTAPQSALESTNGAFTSFTTRITTTVTVCVFTCTASVHVRIS